MAWLGLRDEFASYFSTRGLDANAQARRPNTHETLLTSGTLLFEYRFDPDQTATPIAKFTRASPWRENLSLRMSAAGDLDVTWQQEAEIRHVHLMTGFEKLRETLTIAIVWNAPARAGLVSVMCQESGRLVQKSFANPFPLALSTAEALFRQSALQLGKGTRFAALADTVEPCGPIATIGTSAIIETPSGHSRILDLRAGDPVFTADGDIATVRWVGHQQLPARGAFAPLMMRAPYRGLREDLLIAPSQGLRLTGSRVEYNFGDEEVRAEARYLLDGKSIVRANKRLLVDYAQLVLDRSALLRVSGTALEAFDPHSVLRGGQHALASSLISTLPQALFPARAQAAGRTIRHYEAPAVTY